MPKGEKTVVKQSYFVTDSNMALLRACVERNAAALLIGETGTGKTTLIREVAKEQNKKLIRISVNGSMGVEEILGKWLVNQGTTVWQDGILTAALRTGDWVVMDEINAALPEILFTLHSLLDDDRKVVLPEKDNEVVVPHADFRFFATMNPPEEYAGTKDMNKALMSRFTAVLNIEVLGEVDEVKLLESKGSDTTMAIALVRAAGIMRGAKKKEDIFYFCSTRDLVQCVDLVSSGLKFSDAFLGSVINKMSSKEFAFLKPSIDKVLYADVKIPTKTIEELVETVSNIDADRAKLEKALRAEYEKKMEEYRQQAVREASDQVSDKFLERLKELATK